MKMVCMDCFYQWIGQGFLRSFYGFTHMNLFFSISIISIHYLQTYSWNVTIWLLGCGLASKEWCLQR